MKNKKEKMIESVTGHSCPNCGTICSKKTLQKSTPPEFVEEPYGHYIWDEIHKCKSCKTLYLLHNEN